MVIAPISSAQLAEYSALDHTPAEAAAFQRLIQHWWEMGEGGPEWCFLASLYGRPLGRIGFLGSKRDPRLVEVFDLVVPWEQDHRQMGARLLTGSLAQMAQTGSRHVICRLVAHQPHLDQRRRLLLAAGFELIQERTAFWWPDPWPQLEVSTRLRFRHREQVGEPAFIEAFQRVTVATLDRVDRLKIRLLGLEEHAEGFYDLLKSLNHHGEWWQLGYTHGGELAGLVAPVLLRPKVGSIGYIGVVPELRGEGFGHDLLAQGIAVLQSRGLDAISCETDSKNHPMLRAFHRIGEFQEDPDNTAWVYHKRMTGVTGSGSDGK